MYHAFIWFITNFLMLRSVKVPHHSASRSEYCVKNVKICIFNYYFQHIMPMIDLLLSSLSRPEIVTWNIVITASFIDGHYFFGLYSNQNSSHFYNGKQISVEWMAKLCVPILYIPRTATDTIAPCRHPELNEARYESRDVDSAGWSHAAARRRCNPRF